MIEVVERKGIPVYETVCRECESKLRYTRADMCGLVPSLIQCPVCGVSLTVIPTKGSHVALVDDNGELPKGCASCENKCGLYQSRVQGAQNPFPMTYLQNNRLAGCPLESEDA